MTASKKPLSASSLGALRGFAAIGRHLNLGKAAQDVHLSPSALSHQLRNLEDELGVALFTRTGRGLQFTPAGARLHEAAGACLAQLDEVASAVRQDRTPERLVVSALPTFTMRWLLPRFATFQSRFPNIEIRISVQPVDFERDDVDWAVMYGDGRWPGTIAEFLYQETLVAVCCPALLDPGPIASASDLRRHRLLTARQREQDWDRWFAVAGAQRHPDPDVLALENRNLVIQAAESGLGIAVVDPVMVHEQLARGTLVQCLPHVAHGEGAYYLVRRESASLALELAGFRDWLMDALSTSKA